MILWIKATTDSASLIGLLGMISSIPAVILGAIGGTFADRHSRRNIIILTDMVAGIFILSLAGVFFFFPNAFQVHLSWLFVVSVLSSITAAFFLPAISASIPDLVDKDQLPKANSMNQFSGQISMFIGQGLGGILFMALGAPLLILINSLTFLFSAVSEFFITIPQVIPEKKDKLSEQLSSFMVDIKGGFSFIWYSPGLRKLIFASIFLTFFTIPIIILLPFYVEDFLRVEGYWYGLILSFYGLGALIGYVVAGGLKINGRMRASLTTKFMVGNAILFGLLVIANSPLHGILISTFGGIFSGFISINVITVVQLTTPSATRGRIFGFISAFTGSVTPLGMGLSGVIADLTGQNIPIIYLTCSVCMLIVAIFVLISRDTKEFLAYEEGVEIKTVSPVEQLILKALEYRSNGTYFKALQLLGQALFYDRKDAKLLYYLGLVNFDLSNYNDANWYLRQLLQISPENHEALILQASNYLKQNDPVRAIKMLKSVLNSNPRHKTALLNLAVLYRMQKKLSQSVGLFNKYIKFFPDDIRGYVGLVQNYKLMEQPLDVSKNVEKIKRLNSVKTELNDLLEMKLYTEALEIEKN